jgi:cellulose synthase/poly-beta-1,6-N-acetylglucosamine synthase-like glycosyltransferase
MEDPSLGSILIALFFWISLGSVLYAYFGYPLLVFFLAKIVHKSEASQANQPPITLLIAASNEERVMEDKIANSLAIDCPKKPISRLYYRRWINKQDARNRKKIHQSGGLICCTNQSDEAK